jgi:hypothetical protein
VGASLRAREFDFTIKEPNNKTGMASLFRYLVLNEPTPMPPPLSSDLADLLEEN